MRCADGMHGVADVARSKVWTPSGCEKTAQTLCRLQLYAIWNRLIVQQRQLQVRLHAWLQSNAKTQHVPRSHVVLFLNQVALRCLRSSASLTSRFNACMQVAIASRSACASAHNPLQQISGQQPSRKQFAGMGCWRQPPWHADGPKVCDGPLRVA